MERTILVRSDWLFWTAFEGGPLWPVLSFRLVRPNCPFPFDEIVVPSTALLHPAYKNNNQTRSGLCNRNVDSSVHFLVEFSNLKPEFLLNGKHP